MTMRPEDIKNRTFASALRGYDKDEVRSFLFKVAESSRQLHDRLTATEAELAASAAPAESNVEPGDAQPSDDGNEWAPADYENEWAPGGFDSEPATAGDTPSIDADVVDPMPEAPAFSDEAATTEVQPLASPADTDLAVAEASIADRYEALGDRIADLLRNADASAAEIIAAAERDAEAIRASAETDAQHVRLEAEEGASQMLAEAQAIRTEADAYREEIMAELDAARTEQETALQEARVAAETEVETFRVDSIEEIKALRSDAQVEVEEMRSSAHGEVAELRQAAQMEADQLKEQTLADATASIADDQNEATRLRDEAEADRAAARAELEDVRNEVSTLLEQARTQSEFIKQEADEIIRTKVRSNFEQAQNRLDVLRNTEIASRERILLAQSELSSALNRLDADPLPELDPENSAPVIEEAERRSVDVAPAVEPSVAEEHAPEALAADVIDADVVDTQMVDTEVVDTEVVEADVVESEMVVTEVVEADVVETTISEVVEPDTDETAFEDTSFEQSVFEADVAEATQEIETQEIEESSLSDFFGPGPDTSAAATDDRVADVASAFDADADVNDIGADLDQVGGPIQGWDTTEVESVESTFEVTEHVVVESSDVDELPVRGELPQRNVTETEATPSDSFGAASLAEALPSEMAPPAIGGPAEEDALARLVREAMQEAVDSARKKD